MKDVATSIRGGSPVRGDETAPSLLDCQIAFQRIAKQCVHLIQNSRKSAVAADPDAIHAMRIELTRLRAAVLFFSPMVKDAAWPPIRKELSWLNSALGKARDNDVTANYTRRKRFRRWAKPSQRAVMRAQDKAHRNLAKKLASVRYQRLMAALRHWIARGPWLANGHSLRSEHVDAYSEARLRDWRKAISRKGRRLGALRRKQLHRLRIQCKRYRYILAALQTLGVPIGRQDLAFAETARQVHGALGDLRDLKRLRRTTHDRPPRYRSDQRKLFQKAEKALRRSH